MSAVFAALLGIYVIYALIANRREEKRGGRPRILSVALQGGLFFIACVYAFERGLVSRDLVNPFYLALGLALGHLVFGVSLFANHPVWRDVVGYLVDLRSLRRFLVETPGLLMRFTAVSISEELIYRVAAQGTLFAALAHAGFGGGAAASAAVVVVALVFSVTHRHFFRNALPQSIEFVGFSLLIGALYEWTGSFVFIVGIHTVRNLESVYLEYLAELDETGDEARALEAIEARYAPSRLPQRWRPAPRTP